MIATVAWIVLALSLGAVVAAGYSRDRMPVLGSMAIAAGLRIGFAALTSQSYTPGDVRVYFRHTGVLIEHGRDPLRDLPGRQWNFLELMPYVHAVELHFGMPWVYAVKIAPIIADTALVWLVSRLSSSAPRTRALQYALNPVSLLVVSLHGQVEPVALAFALGGVVLLRKTTLGGLLLGAAIAAKTWPVVMLLAVLPGRKPARSMQIIVAAAVVPVLCLLSGLIFLDTRLAPELRRLVSYSSYVDNWTWAGALIAAGHKDLLGYNSPVGRLGSALIAIGVLVTLVLLRNRPSPARALGVLCAVLVCTAGFGNQYLMWVVPLMMAISGPVRFAYLLTATIWDGIAYLSPFGDPAFTANLLRGLSWLPAIMLLAVIVEQVQISRRLPLPRPVEQVHY